MSRLKKEDLHHNPVLRSFQLFFAKTTSGGIVLIIATIIAMVWANSPLHELYHHVWHTETTVKIGEMLLFDYPFHYVINDVLMVIFFFLVGLEIKRELLIGELSSVRKAMLPVVGAIGGVVGPVLIYISLNWGDPTAMKGWAVPMATDIAFSLGVLALIGSRVPLGVKVFLAALAIVDDLMAILVIAIGYTENISFVALGWGAFFLFLMYACNRLKVNNSWVYFFFGIGLWYAFLQSGVHATIAGVIAAFTIPSRSLIDKQSFFKRTDNIWTQFKNSIHKNDNSLMTELEEDSIMTMEKNLERVQSPLHRLEHGLNPYVAFIIMPIFALANAGIYFGDVSPDVMTSMVTWGIVLGLFFGKIIGISFAVWISIKLNIAGLPSGTTFKHIIAVSILCAIGFTMALFVSGLSFESGSPEENFAKIGIIAASVIAAFIGLFVLSSAVKDQAKHEEV
jgi:Na+:H+ antiporter, NhaA family